MKSAPAALVALVFALPAAAAPEEEPVAHGSGWRTRGSVLESAVAGMRITAPKGWRLLAGEEAEAVDPNADLGLALEGGGLTITMDAQEALGMGAGDRKEEMLVNASLGRAHVPGGKEIEVVLGGLKFPLEPWTEKEGGALLWIGGVGVEGRGYCVTARCGPARRAEAATRIPEGVAAFSPIGDRERIRLEADLLALPDVQAALLPEACLRRGVVRDFGRGVQWRLPRAFWSLHLHDGRLATEIYQRFLVATVSDRVTGVEGTLEFHPTVAKELPDYQSEMVSWFLDQSEGASAGSGANGEKPPKSKIDRPVLVDFCGTKGLSTRVRDGEGWEWLVVSAMRGRDGVTVWFNGEEAAMEAAGEFVRAALAGVTREPGMQAESTAGGVFRSEVMGFAMDLPEGAVRQPVPEGDPGAVSRGVAWTAGAVRFEVWMLKDARYLENLRQADGILAREEGRPGPRPVARATLAGLPCIRTERVEGGRVSTFSLARDGIVTMLVVTAPRDAPESAIEDVRARFRFLE